MVPEIEVRSLTLYQNDDGKRPYAKLAFADVHVRDLDMNIHQVLLTHDPAKGYIALAPLARGHTGLQPIQWLHKGVFAKAIAEAITTAYFAMGGKPPKEDAK